MYMFALKPRLALPGAKLSNQVDAYRSLAE